MKAQTPVNKECKTCKFYRYENQTNYCDRYGIFEYGSVAPVTDDCHVIAESERTNSLVAVSGGVVCPTASSS